MFSNRINKAINYAIEVAKDNPCKFRLAAIGVNKRGKVISVGINSSKTHPFQAKLAAKNGHEDQIGLHAEIACLIRAKSQVKTLIVVRLLHNGEIANASPCPICREAITHAEVKQIIYSNDNGEFILEKQNAM